MQNGLFENPKRHVSQPGTARFAAPFGVGRFFSHPQPLFVNVFPLIAFRIDEDGQFPRRCGIHAVCQPPEARDVCGPGFLSCAPCAFRESPRASHVRVGLLPCSFAGLQPVYAGLLPRSGGFATRLRSFAGLQPALPMLCSSKGYNPPPRGCTVEPRAAGMPHLLFRSIADNHSSFLCRKVDKKHYLCSKMPNRMDD